MSLPHFILLVGIALAWGLNFVMAKLGLGEVPPFLFTTLRFVTIAILLAPFLRWAPGQMKYVAAIGVTAGFLHFALMFTGISLTDASVAAVVVQLNVPFATILSVALLGETVGWRRLIGIILAFSGVALISFDPRVFGYLNGVLLMIGGAASMAVAMILMRRIKGVGPLQMQAWLAWISVPALLALTFAFEGHQWATITHTPLWAWGTILYSAVAASIFGHAAMYYLIQRYEVSLVGPLTLLAPVCGILFSVWLLGEGLTWRIALGAVITLGGVAIVAARQSSAAGEELEAV